MGAVRHDRHYTLEEARELLPWVEARLAAIRAALDVLARPGARAALGRTTPGNGGGGLGKEAGEAFLRLQAETAALEQREIVLRDARRGLLDFPGLREGREVYLCWIDGEDDIRFWHDLDAGYAGRQPL
jgi:hypothetical protein